MTKSKECGTKAPFALTIDGESIFIQFKSQVVTTVNRGFMAGFVAYKVGKNNMTFCKGRAGRISRSCT